VREGWSGRGEGWEREGEERGGNERGNTYVRKG